MSVVALLALGVCSASFGGHCPNLQFTPKALPWGWGRSGLTPMVLPINLDLPPNAHAGGPVLFQLTAPPDDREYVVSFTDWVHQMSNDPVEYDPAEYDLTKAFTRWRPVIDETLLAPPIYGCICTPSRDDRLVLLEGRLLLLEMLHELYH